MGNRIAQKTAPKLRGFQTEIGRYKGWNWMR